MRATLTTLGPLDCHLVEAEGTRPELAVLLCHGFGATGDDLVPLAEAILRHAPALQGRVRFCFPEAPLTLGDMGFGHARAWWMIDLQSIAARRAGDAAALERHREEVPPGLAEARRALRATFDALCLQSGLGPGQVVLGGFSQGAMITTDLALRLEEPPAALCILSGSLVAAPEWRRLAPGRAGLRLLQTHGTADPILPWANAVALRDLLLGAGLAVEFHGFEGEHGLPGDCVDRLASLLERA